MTTLTISKPTAPGFWAKLLNGFRAFDEALVRPGAVMCETPMMVR